MEGEYNGLQISRSNRGRLLLQNKKLYLQVFKLEQLINNIIEKTVVNEFEGIQETEELKKKYRQEEDQQLKYIAKLKKDIKQMKATLAEHKYDEVKNQQNQLTYFKREMHKLISERDTLLKQKIEKDSALEYHKPINNQTLETMDMYRKTKAINGELKYKVHEMEREVGKYHKIKELAKTAVPKEIDNPQFELGRMSNEIGAMRKEMKKIEEKWKTKIESQDREYFQFKQITSDKHKQVEALEKQIKNLEIRFIGMRDDVAMLSDRDRLGSVVISPQKRKEMENIIDQEGKKTLKRLQTKKHQKNSKSPEKQNKSTELKIIDKKGKQQKIQLIATKQSQETYLTSIKQKEDEIKSQKIQPETKLNENATQYSHGSHSHKAERDLQAQMLVKPKKMLQSVGVGTSFYYSDD